MEHLDEEFCRIATPYPFVNQTVSKTQKKYFQNASRLIRGTLKLQLYLSFPAMCMDVQLYIIALKLLTQLKTPKPQGPVTRKEPECTNNGES